MSMIMLSKGSFFVRTRSSINSTSESSSNKGSSLMIIGGSDLMRSDKGAGVLRSSSTLVWSLSCLNVLSRIEYSVSDHGLPEPHPSLR